MSAERLLAGVCLAPSLVTISSAWTRVTFVLALPSVAVLSWRPLKSLVRPPADTAESPQVSMEMSPAPLLLRQPEASAEGRVQMVFAPTVVGDLKPT